MPFCYKICFLQGTDQLEAMKAYADEIETQRKAHEGQGKILGNTPAELFRNAQTFMQTWENSHMASIEEKLTTFKYMQQATEGDCNIEPHEWVDQTLGSEKWEVWKSVAGMHRHQAMVLYVDMIERMRAEYGDRHSPAGARAMV